MAALPIAAGIGALGSIVGGITGGKGAKKAAQLQYQASQDALHQQAAQFAATQANEQPFIGAGTSALGGLGNLIGLNGNDPQQTAITALQNSPYYQSLFRNGQEAVLQNAAATGGIRGGNTQRGLADFGADTLARTIQQQLANLMGVTTLGANTAAGLGSLSQANSNAQSGLIENGGAAKAGGVLGQVGAINGGINNALSSLAPWLSSLKFGGSGFGGGVPDFGTLGSGLGVAGTETPLPPVIF